MKSFDLTIKAGWLIDGSGTDIKKDMIINVNDGLFHSIKPFCPDYIKKIDFLDLSDCVLLPGLIDCHVHLIISGTNDKDIRKNQLTLGFDEAKKNIENHLKMYLRKGIVAVRDGGDYGSYTLKYKITCFNEKKTPIKLNATGKAIYKKGRYGKLIGCAIDKDESPSDKILGQNYAVDHIKIINSGINSLLEFGKETLPQFNTEELKAVVAKGNKIGIKTMVHANGRSPVEIAIASGCHSIEHGFFMGKDNLIKMSENKVSWVPTACTMKACYENTDKSYIEAEISKKNLEHQLEQIFQAKKIGTTIALGTDSGSLGVHHGAYLIEELKLLVQAGFSIPEAIKCATSNAAQLLGLFDLGAISPGKAATFIAVKQEPSSLIESLNNIEALYIRGKAYNFYDS